MNIVPTSEVRWNAATSVVLSGFWSLRHQFGRVACYGNRQLRNSKNFRTQPMPIAGSRCCPAWCWFVASSGKGGSAGLKSARSFFLTWMHLLNQYQMSWGLKWDHVSYTLGRHFMTLFDWNVTRLEELTDAGFSRLILAPHKRDKDSFNPLVSFIL
jgi:hypothetical protein